MRHREDDEVRGELALAGPPARQSLRGSAPPRRPGFAGGRRSRPRGAARQLCRDVPAENPALGEELTRQRQGAGRHPHLLRREPPHEVLRIVWEERHPRRRDVDAVGGVLGGIGHAGPELRPRLHDDDLHVPAPAPTARGELRPRRRRSRRQNRDERAPAGLLHLHRRLTRSPPVPASASGRAGAKNGANCPTARSRRSISASDASRPSRKSASQASYPGSRRVCASKKPRSGRSWCSITSACRDPPPVAPAAPAFPRATAGSSRSSRGLLLEAAVAALVDRARGHQAVRADHQVHRAARRGVEVGEARGGAERGLDRGELDHLRLPAEPPGGACDRLLHQHLRPRRPAQAPRQPNNSTVHHVSLRDAPSKGRRGGTRDER